MIIQEKITVQGGFSALAGGGAPVGKVKKEPKVYQ